MRKAIKKDLVFDAEVIKFNFNSITKQLLVPHMGWNSVRIKKNNKLLIEPNDNYRFYFVPLTMLNAQEIQM